MSSELKTMAGPGKPSASALPTWWLLFIKEVTELWIGGKALILVFIYTLVLGVVTYVIANNGEFSLILPKEMIYETIETIIEVCLFIGLIISADSLSGERERNTLESLLLTSASRRQIIAGKFLACVTFWPVAFVIAILTLRILSQGDAAFGPAIFWGALLGTVLYMTYVGLGMLVSFWSNTNKTSYIVSLGIYILFLIPAEMPEHARESVMGQLLQWINPLAAVNYYFSTVLVNKINFSESLVWLQAPFVFAILVLGILFVYAAPGLRLEEGRDSSRSWLNLNQNVDMGDPS
ncbi:MAG: ABC transporter permease subunit [Anaerolineales bacterium]